MNNEAQAIERSPVSVARIGLATHLVPSDSLTTQTIVDALTSAFDASLTADSGNYIIDLSRSALLNSEALEAILDMRDRLTARGNTLKTARVGPAIHEIFLITRFYERVASLDDNRQRPPGAPAEAAVSPRLGDRLVERGSLTSAQLQQALDIQNSGGGQLGKIVTAKGWVSAEDLLSVLSEQLRVPFVSLRSRIYDPDVIALLEKETAKRLRVLPLYKIREELFLATANPQSLPVFKEVEERTGLKVRPVLAVRDDILQAINDQTGGADYAADYVAMVDDDFEVVEGAVNEDYTTIDEMAAGSPVINLVNSIIQRAVRNGASDIHIEAFRTQSRVRYRIDGVLFEFESPRIELHAPMVSRLKVMANLDISERRLPQDGRIQVHTQGRSVDLRFSSLPGLHGEKVVLRVLDKKNAIMNLDSLGMEGSNLTTFRSLLGLSNGLILVTGPTGSGKTTSLYSALNHVNSIERNIVTIEDPVEYQMDIINQNEVRTNIGLSFAKLLKHVLRQDPDIIMVGEIRERETAEIAVQAALTGHLVLSTLHTNDSVGAVTRLIDMGVEPYLLSSALVGVVAQRLVRTVCPSCRTTSLAPPEIKQRFNWPADEAIQLASGRGCNECFDSGYKGRLAIHETLETGTDLQQLIISNPSRDELLAFLAARNHRSLFDDGIARVLEGTTSLEEVSRAVSM